MLGVNYVSWSVAVFTVSLLSPYCVLLRTWSRHTHSEHVQSACGSSKTMDTILVAYYVQKNFY